MRFLYRLQNSDFLLNFPPLSLGIVIRSCYAWKFVASLFARFYQLIIKHSSFDLERQPDRLTCRLIVSSALVINHWGRHKFHVLESCVGRPTHINILSRPIFYRLRNSRTFHESFFLPYLSRTERNSSGRLWCYKTCPCISTHWHTRSIFGGTIDTVIYL